MNPLLEVVNLKKYFVHSRGILFRKKIVVKAVDGVSFSINRGETFGLVGESGSGKTTVGLTILMLYKPTSGKVFFDGMDITEIPRRKMKEFRRRVSVVFQDPYSSLNPRMTVRQHLLRPLKIHKIASGEKADELIIETLRKVGLGVEHVHRYPHQLSGGQQQRVAIARAIILRPDLIILDEPTSSLDVSVRAQILNLLLDLQKDMGLTYLFISHDLLTIRHMSDKIGVMYLGKIVEIAETDELFKNMKHPYTATLLSAAPIPDPRRKSLKKMIIRGEPSSPINIPKGCRFHPRCPYAIEKCSRKEPSLVDIGGGHVVACHRIGEIDVSSEARAVWSILIGSRQVK